MDKFTELKDTFEKLFESEPFTKCSSISVTINDNKEQKESITFKFVVGDNVKKPLILSTTLYSAGSSKLFVNDNKHTIVYANSTSGLDKAIPYMERYMTTSIQKMVDAVNRTENK